MPTTPPTTFAPAPGSPIQGGSVEDPSVVAARLTGPGSQFSAPPERTVMLLGDSISARNTRPSLDQPAGAILYNQLYSTGFLVWAGVLGRQRFIFEPKDNFGKGGDTTTGMLSRTDAMLAANAARTVVIAGGTNDCLPPGGGTIDLPTHKSNILTIIKKCQDAGRKVVLVPPRPRGDATFGTALSAAGIKQLLAEHDFQMNLTAMSGVSVVDSWKYLADPASTLAYMKTGFTVDGLHFGPTGAYWEGLALAEVLGLGTAPGLFPYINVLPGSNADQYDAANDPGGSLLGNPMFQGTAGVVGGGGSGSLADVWNGGAGSGTGIQRAYSKVNGKQQITISGTLTGSNSPFLVNQVPTPANLSAGDVIEGYCDIEVDAGMASVYSMQFTAIDTVGLGNYTGLALKPDDAANSLMPPVAWAGVIKLPRTAIVSPNLSVGLTVQVKSGDTVAGTVRVGAAKLSKVQ